jgi:hypothetical protein
MQLWIVRYQTVATLRPACARTRTFLWLVVVLAAMTVRTDLAGVTSLVRSHWLRPSCYHRLLYFFHSPALDLPKLIRIWTAPAPSELVVAHALRNSLPDFLLSLPYTDRLKKFLASKLAPKRCPNMCLIQLDEAA